MIESVNALISVSFPFLFLLIAVITKKDLAVLSASAAMIGIMVASSVPEGWSQMMWFCMLNSLVCIGAASYNRIHACNLSLTVGWLAGVQAAINAIQLVDSNVIYGTITGAIEAAIMISLITMDGRKGMLNGLFRDFSSVYQRRFSHHSHNNNHKGHS